MTQQRCSTGTCGYEDFCVGCNNCVEHCKCTQLEREVRQYHKTTTFKAVPEMGPDAPIIVNDKGAKQAYLPFRCDLLPGKALLDLSKILKRGDEKYGGDNWRNIPRHEHINHALAHLFALGAGDDSDDHLGHAACRLLFALET